ncbi:MAG: hypothetical protein OHK0022_59140 [Roseiflexaceae bacterium]
MQAYRIETTIQQSGTLKVDNLPLQAGEKVEVIILVQPTNPAGVRYPLHGVPITYHQPTDPVASDDWESACFS